MSVRRTRDPLLSLVQGYFTSHLQRTCGASPHTIRAYGHSLRLFFAFLAGQKRRSIAKLKLTDIDVEAVLGFLAHIESARSNSVSTRNCRLAAIRGLAEYGLRYDLTHADQFSRILAIPTKKSAPRRVRYLEPEEFRVILATTEASVVGRRDHALLLFLYNTGARISEALAVRPQDLSLIRPKQVRLLGKGRKERLCPIWQETARVLGRLIKENAVPKENVVFRNLRGAPLTRDGAAFLLNKRVRLAAKSLPSLRNRRVTPHVLRHSCAVALLQAGVDICVIRDYLGHSSIATTNRYIATNLRMKREALDVFWEKAKLERQPQTAWSPSPNLLAFLTSL